VARERNQRTQDENAQLLHGDRCFVCLRALQPSR
jgi:hypothetical protein